MMNFSIFQKGNRYGIIDNSGMEILPPEYIQIEYANEEGLYIVHQLVDNSFYWTQCINMQHYVVGLYNANTHNWILPCENYSIWHFDTKYHLACVIKRHNGKSSGFINPEGLFVIPPIYDMPYWEQFDTYGLMPLKLNDRWGVLDYRNNVQLEFKYDYIEPFTEGSPFTRIELNGKTGYIDNSVKIIISPQYEEGISFINSGGFWRTIVKYDSKYYIIDENHKILSLGYKCIRILIGEHYYAEAFCYSLIKGWYWEKISLISGNSIERGWDKQSKDILAKAVIYGTTAAASAAVSALANICGAQIPYPLKQKYSNEARDRMWRQYMKTGDILDALGEIVR